MELYGFQQRICYLIMKFFDDPTIRLPRLREDMWFDLHQDLLLQIANTKFGRQLLCIPQEYGKIFLFKKNCVHFVGNGVYHADFRIGAKWANVIRYKWDQFNSYSRYFQAYRSVFSTENFEKLQILSPLVRTAVGMSVGLLTSYPDPDPEKIVR